MAATSLFDHDAERVAIIDEAASDFEPNFLFNSAEEWKKFAFLKVKNIFGDASSYTSGSKFVSNLKTATTPVRINRQARQTSVRNKSSQVKSWI